MKKLKSKIVYTLKFDNFNLEDMKINFVIAAYNTYPNFSKVEIAELLGISRNQLYGIEKKFRIENIMSLRNKKTKAIIGYLEQQGYTITKNEKEI